MPVVRGIYEDEPREHRTKYVPDAANRRDRRDEPAPDQATSERSPEPPD
jgi:hypothetical protein